MSFILISLLILIIISLLYIISWFLNGNLSVDSEKLSVYECGFEPIGDSRMKFDIIYWVIGILYLIFDLELIFLFPFSSLILFNPSFFANIILFIFLSILTLGFIYEWFQGALKLN